MSQLLKTVDMKTNIAGENRLELLIFYLSSKQAYGINVFKVKEVYFNPEITVLPGSHPSCVGVTHFRGRTIPVIDLAKAVGLPPLPESATKTIITSEYNRTMQGLMVGSVDRIVNKNWDEVHTPPAGTGSNAGSYIISITEVDDKLVEVIDVELVLEQICPKAETVSDELLECESLQQLKDAQREILIADDSAVARRKITNTLEQLGLKVVAKKTGKETLEHLMELADQGINVNEKYLMLISDIEMPEMDGYTMVNHIRKDPRLEHLYIAMHSSMSGDFNESLVEKVGADLFIPKFHPDEFATMVKERLSVKWHE